MDPRQSLSRTTSSNVPQNNYNPNNMATSYSMPPYPNSTHLPPINYASLPPGNQPNYMQQQPSYRGDIQRYPSSSGPGPSTPDRYNGMATHSNMQGLPPASMLPQPQSHTPQPQGYQGQQQTRQGYQQPLAPAPPRPNLDPMAQQYGHPDQRQQQWSGPEGMPGMASDVGRDPTRTHVVGSQGRRGILPSAPGRPPVAPNGLNGSPKGGQIPQKDADGKFPCPNCTKTYLHAKHLKRHMLRHTGDRPYMCVLCNDTFSRSDILKRHFQKCSVRRGNPTGASHLSNPAAHLKKSQAAAAKAAQNAASTASPQSATTPASAGLPGSAYTTTSMPANSIPTTAGGPPPSSMPYSMSNNPQADMQRAAPGQPASAGGMEHGAPNSWGMHNAGNPQMMYQQNANQPDHFGMQRPGGDDKRSAMPNAHGMGDQWNPMFHGDGNEHYMNPMFSGYDQSHPEVKNEGHEGGANGYSYLPQTSLGADGTLGPSLWHLSTSEEDHPLQYKVDRLVDFCFPLGIQESLQEQQNNSPIRAMLSLESINHFLALSSNLQGHFPWLHMPTFNINSCYEGLLLAVICNGAVYSDRVSQSQVRALVGRVKDGIEKTARVIQVYHSNGPYTRLSLPDQGAEELCSLHMMHNLTLWHGGPVEREAARNQCKFTLTLIARFGLLGLADSNDPQAYSYLHRLQPGQGADPLRWDWHPWVEQEKRIRLVYMAFLFDSAMCLYFNLAPTYEISEMTLPLPADDACWEAPIAERCAQALGLLGPDQQAAVNITGSLRMKSLEFSHAWSALFSPSLVLQPRMTNVYSKFILIHALHIDIWHLQRERSYSPANSPHMAAQNPRLHGQIQNINKALARWKQSWDQDMALQYPPGNGGLKRVGFCRDGTQFYWLAKALMQPNRIHDWQLPADNKLRMIMKGLSLAREWTLSDGARRGEEPGHVALIDDDYATSEPMILDMRKLFRPIE